MQQQNNQGQEVSEVEVINNTNASTMLSVRQPKTFMIQKIATLGKLIKLLFSLCIISFYGCNSDNKNIRTSKEIKRQIDSAEYKPIIASYKTGKQLFSQYCNTCHVAPEINKTDQYLFDELFERLPSPAEEYFISYISDSKALKASGNQYAKQVDDVWQQDYEHNFKDSLSSNGLFNLITYIKIAARQRYKNNGR